MNLSKMSAAGSTFLPSGSTTVANCAKRSERIISKTTSVSFKSHSRAYTIASSLNRTKISNVRCMASSTAPPTPAISHETSFQNVKTEQDLLKAIETEINAKRLPPQAGMGMRQFFYGYYNAAKNSSHEDPMGISVKIMAAVFDRIMIQIIDPYTFPSFHRRMLEPYDYYAFGQNYVRPLLDFKNSFLGNAHLLDEIQERVDSGGNVLFLANHQTEADPAVLALTLEHTHPKLAENMIYIAGDRVVLDPFCKPFSMGRNLLCVFSRKRLYDQPELVEKKMAANRKTLKEMTALFKRGGNIIWVAPSGGRDRPNPETDRWEPASFDPITVETMVRLTLDSGPKGYLYPLSLLCYDIMPPPKSIEKKLGEERVIGYHGVGVCLSNALNVDEITKHLDRKDREKTRETIAEYAFNRVMSSYNVLFSTLHGDREGLEVKHSKNGSGIEVRGHPGSGPDEVVLTQPWLE